MRRRIGVRVAGATLVLCGIVVATDVRTGEDPRPAPASAPGMKAYVDPTTGALLPGRPASLPSAPAPAGMDASTAGLVEVPTPGGGVMVDLQGRFQNALVATIEPDGTMRVRHAGE